ncbi:dihydroneopterin aldolase [Oceanibaculum pacificum]|uniref:dihydroneopterin aldolase n=1 Tax=Oceanibaculum pacificum TaxID=580166 RepID=UPI001E55EBF0|nr:dihydroneopterin aldolase [Oceanibaculum pacificum]
MQALTGLPKELALYRIFVRDLVLLAEVGVYDSEKNRQQRIRLNIELDCEDTIAGAGDRIDGVVCYFGVVERIKAMLAERHINLIETVADRAAALCLHDARVVEARVTVEKLDVLESAASVGVTVARRR